jgi:hypothetical protein
MAVGAALSQAGFIPGDLLTEAILDLDKPKMFLKSTFLVLVI